MKDNSVKKFLILVGVGAVIGYGVLGDFEGAFRGGCGGAVFGFFAALIDDQLKNS